jgi:hypothetical protein
MWQVLPLFKKVLKYFLRSVLSYTVIRFLWVSDKFSTCTVVSVNETLIEEKMRRFKGECAHFIFNKGPIYTHDGASAKFSTNSHETDNSVVRLDSVSGFLSTITKSKNKLSIFNPSDWLSASASQAQLWEGGVALVIFLCRWCTICKFLQPIGSKRRVSIGKNLSNTAVVC